MQHVAKVHGTFPSQIPILRPLTSVDPRLEVTRSLEVLNALRTGFASEMKQTQHRKTGALPMSRSCTVSVSCNPIVWRRIIDSFNLPIRMSPSGSIRVYPFTFSKLEHILGEGWTSIETETCVLHVQSEDCSSKHLRPTLSWSPERVTDWRKKLLVARNHRLTLKFGWIADRKAVAKSTQEARKRSRDALLKSLNLHH